MTLKSILYKVPPIKGFIYESVRFSATRPETIEVTVVPRRGSAAHCRGCGRACPTCDQPPLRAGG